MRDPLDAFEGEVFEVGCGKLRGEENQHDLFGALGVAVARAIHLAPDGNGVVRDAEFFVQFARQPLLERLARADLAAGKLPLERKVVAAAALADQHPAIAFHECGDDGDHSYCATQLTKVKAKHSTPASRATS